VALQGRRGHVGSSCPATRATAARQQTGPQMLESIHV
jgi:hypothetical protein